MPQCNLSSKPSERDAVANSYFSKEFSKMLKVARETGNTERASRFVYNFTKKYGAVIGLNHLKRRATRTLEGSIVKLEPFFGELERACILGELGYWEAHFSPSITRLETLREQAKAISRHAVALALPAPLFDSARLRRKQGQYLARKAKRS